MPVKGDSLYGDKRIYIVFSAARANLLSLSLHFELTFILSVGARPDYVSYWLEVLVVFQ